MKTIALSQSLEGLKVGLQELGYTVILNHEIQHPVDVYIYEDDESRQSLYSTNQMLSNVTISTTLNNPKHSGTLLINGSGKSLEDIQYIIHNKAYSPIF